MRAFIGVCLWTFFIPFAAAQEKPYSGPQPGEPLRSFQIRKALGEDAGKEMDFIKQAKGSPILLVFVHEVNRPAMAFTRALTQYTLSRSKDGISTGVVWLADDPTEAESMIQRVQVALPKNVPIGISLDGREGPGSYGLNRNVTLTILLGDKDKVTDNFALVQPSLQSDLPIVIKSVLKLVGGEMPKLEELTNPSNEMRSTEMRPQRGNPESPNLRPYLTPIIRLNAKPEEVDEAAKKLMEFIDKNDAAKKELGRIASTIVNANKLESYGTPRAQEYLSKWAKEFGTNRNESDSPESSKSKSSDRK